MGFEEFCSIKVGNSDDRLIHALAERWWPSTHTFHFPCGELGFISLDFIMLTGISFGRGHELPYNERYSKLEEAKNMFPGIASSDIRAFIAYMMGNLFFSNGSTSLQAGHLAALTDYDIIGTSFCDWGTLIMATLYRRLDEVSILKDGKATGDPHDMGWFMDVAEMNDQRRRISIPVMQVPYSCPPTYSMDELWHQSQGMWYAAYEDSRKLIDRNFELEEELSSQSNSQKHSQSSNTNQQGNVFPPQFEMSDPSQMPNISQDLRLVSSTGKSILFISNWFCRWMFEYHADASNTRGKAKSKRKTVLTPIIVEDVVEDEVDDDKERYKKSKIWSSGDFVNLARARSQVS
ncbi:hypothetical protein GIB67_034462 [Kingdonia uniflora]|uniref:Aminotransferase-like plant mobile domain-containing protein n=1 Tax=Kingdonia uniflora TaxID=39325 RepID=A0A7J7PB89_9MAGN|nr:hypothetical protein GIB67_034462 [Kingdonia uniflora]